MKANHLILKILFLMFPSFVLGQITESHVYEGTVRLSYPEKQYYYKVDFSNLSMLVYDLNHNLTETIQINVPDNYFLYDVSYVSEKLFNTDSNIEFLALFYRYVQDTDTTGHYDYETQIISESGDILLDIPNGGYSEIYQDADDHLKMLSYLYDFTEYVYIAQTKIFDLPGSVSSVKNRQDDNLPNAYPNPAQERFTLNFNQKLSGYPILVLENINGQIVKKVRLRTTGGKTTIGTEDLKSGTYLYYLKINDQTFPAKKLIITK